ncbi:MULTISPECIES: deoxyribose-phosphate aldolase [unclassified Sporolactobacillus]|uniref:deoxyribose-phosphate aldolase n=1 Tax=unclassified Sporolactobacillus TaxID=2628533 RepID=UPI00236753BB|nr:deoxyribose-phosphate aldolase [Sporolactobacillus sp. CQH2019]MDD9150292.1 deoxyribose-phosphate aldolase [Sporolactobacillus sp. CQH2019]
MTEYTLDELCRLIDHTNLKPDATKEDIEKLCREAKTFHFRMVAVNQVQSGFCSQLLKDTDVHVGAAVSFPLGQTSIKAKAAEARDALDNGADEIDYVINIAEVKNQNDAYIKEEMSQIVSVCHQYGAVSKAIFENAYLTKSEIVKVANIAKEVRPDFIKTSTGFGPGGATCEDVRLMKQTVGTAVKVKAAGGIRDAETFIKMIESGAERIGCSSGIKIVTGLKKIMEETGKAFIGIDPNI